MKKTLMGCAALTFAGALLFAMPAATQTGPARAAPAPAPAYVAYALP